MVILIEKIFLVDKFGGGRFWISSNLSNFNTQNITNMRYNFWRCKSLTNIDLSNFKANNIKDMRHMFYNCSSLKNIDLSNFNTNNVTDMSSMFYKCSSLRKENIITKDWHIKNQPID